MSDLKEMTEHLAVLRRIESMVRKVLPRSFYIDKEELSVAIFMELWLDPEKILCWTQVRNRCLDELRKFKVREGRFKRVPLESLESFITLDEASIDQKDLLNHLMECSFLGEDERKVLYWRFYQSLTFREIGFKLNVGRTQAKLLLRRGLEKIRKWSDLSGLSDKEI